MGKNWNGFFTPLMGLYTLEISLWAAVVFAVIFPEAGKLLFPYNLPIQFILLYVSFFDLDLREISRSAWKTAVITLAIYFVVIAVSWGIASQIETNPAALAGLAIIITAPYGIGNIALSKELGVKLSTTSAVVVLSTVASIAVIPAFSSYALAKTVPVDAQKMFIELFVLIIVPLVLAQISKKLVPKLAILRETRPLLMFLLIWPITSSGIQRISDLTFAALLVIALMFVLYYVLQRAASRLARTERVETILVRKNTGLAATLAATHFTPAAALPAIAYSIVLNLVQGAIIRMRRGKSQ
ncbi:Uncharacterised protein [Candidatus Gugararchaeum adminiculabundum]|nr:Uncharacterised protein [Candidatus Gugararchaeum adminiculabundum]